jgi:glycosyltransferase involved in cell wall biosynthesis
MKTVTSIAPVVSPLACLAGLQVLLISHDFSISGSPLLLLEAAREMRRAGARVTLTSLRDDAPWSRIPGIDQETVVPIRGSPRVAAQSDLVIANTAVTGPWIHEYLAGHPRGGRRLVWWLHEIDTKLYGAYVRDLDRTAALVVDSAASLSVWRSAEIAFPPIVEVVHPGVRASLLAAVDRVRHPYVPPGILRRLGWHRSVTRAQIRKSLGVGAGDFLVALFGAYTPHKGHVPFAETVARMLAETPTLPIKALLIGFPTDGEAREFVERLGPHGQSALGPERALRIVKDLSPYYAASDALVMNSQGPGENFGRVTIEAMAFRLPVCGTDAGGTREIVVDGETGLLHPVGEAGQSRLAANLRRLIGDRGLARRLGETGHRRVRERFNDTAMFEALATTLHRVIAEER